MKPYDNNLLLKAIELSMNAHKSQVRRGGAPYIVHPLRVARSVRGVELKIIAILHDIVEDTKVTLDTVEEMFGHDVASAVDHLSRRQSEDYEVYIDRLKLNNKAVEVKIADIIDNLSDLPSDEAIKKSEQALLKLIA